VKVEPVMVEAACYEHGLEPVGQGGVVQREQAVAFVRLEQGIEGRPELRPQSVLRVFTNAECLARMDHDTMLVDLATQDGRDFGRTLRRHEAHSQGGMKVEGNVEVATSVACGSYDKCPACGARVLTASRREYERKVEKAEALFVAGFFGIFMISFLLEGLL